MEYFAGIGLVTVILLVLIAIGSVWVHVLTKLADAHLRRENARLHKRVEELKDILYDRNEEV